MSVDSIHILLNTTKQHRAAFVEKKKEYKQLTLF